MLRPQDGIQVDKFYPPYDWQYNTIPLTVVGNLTVVDGVVSGFSDSNYLTVPQFNDIENASIELVLNYTTVAKNQNRRIFRFGTDNSNAYYLRIAVETTYISWYTTDKIYTTNLKLQNYNYVKLKTQNGLGNNVEIWLSVDGINWIQATLTESSNSQTFTNNVMVLYRNFPTSADINKCYIKINGTKYIFTLPNQTLAPIDIRKNTENNTITLLYGHSADFSKYSLFGLLAQVSSGTYDVYIDDVLVGSGVTSNTQYDIDFSQIATSYGTATTPEALVLHKIVIKPTTEGETITRFRGILTSGATGTQIQGVLWCHFELDNEINIASMCNASSTNQHRWILFAHTAKNNAITLSSSPNIAYRQCSNLIYVPYLSSTTNILLSQIFQSAFKIKRINVRKATNIQYYAFAGSSAIEQINIKEKPVALTGSATQGQYVFASVYSLKQLPVTKFNNLNMSNIVTGVTNLYPTKIDATNATSAAKIGIFGSADYPMRGLRGLKVSNEAPFSGTSPQIDVSYTGLDRDALVELFNSLPAFQSLIIVGSPTISSGVVSGFSAGNYLSLNTDKTISNSIVFNLKLNIVTGSTTQCIYRSTSTGIGIRVSSRNKVTLWDSNNSTFLTSDTLTDGIYFVRIVIGKNHQELQMSNDGITYSVVDTANISDYNINSLLKATIGYNTAQATQSFLGAIDITNSSIELDKQKYKLTLPDDITRILNIANTTGNNLTVVGSATIDENGVVSGFSTSNYLAIGASSTIINSLEIITKIVTKPTTITNNALICSLNGNVTFRAYVASNKKVQFSFKDTNGTTRYVSSDILVDDNQYWKFVLNDKGGFKYYSFDGINWIESGSNTNGSPDFSGGITSGRFGYLSNTYNVFDGSINLENTSIKIDNNYIMKGYLTDTDKNIALNKGWALTLS